MEKILICPGERAAVGFLSQAAPLVTTPLLGESLLSYWIEALALAGTKEVILLATDRPDHVRKIVANGTRWGVRAEVHSELRELTVAEATESFGTIILGSGSNSREVITLDHLPGLDQLPLFRSYGDYFRALVAWMPRAAKTNRIGLREIEPQVWCGRRVRIARGAKVYPPCWLGDHVAVGPEAVVGPGAILEDRVVVGAAAEVRSSIVGPDTLIGRLTRVENSIAWGSTLINWCTGSCTQVPDPFLMCGLAQRYSPESASDLPSRSYQLLRRIASRCWGWTGGSRNTSAAPGHQ